MSSFNDEDIKQLAKIGKRIATGLSCDANGHGVPCRTDRFDAVDAMIEYLTMHNYLVVDMPMKEVQGK